MDDGKLKELFSRYGKRVRFNLHSGERCKGFGFVCFSSPEEASKAMKEMNGRVLGTRALYVVLAWARPAPARFKRAPPVLTLHSAPVWTLGKRRQKERKKHRRSKTANKND
uniref:RRM domain-containing protein n=1 Tax=Salarias fasciatus TaxID=181472 RepID=A0A672FB14_SALFA